MITGISGGIGHLLLIVTAVVFLLLAGTFVAKLLRHPDAVRAELKHPVKLSFFPAISIGMFLLAIAGQHHEPELAAGLWRLGAVVHFALMLFILNSWVNHPHFKVVHINPAWFIPAVGNVLVPIAGAGLDYHEISWFFFSVGMLFWIVLLTLVFNRVLFHDPLPAKLEPTLFILIAPPAVGFVSWVKLTGGVDEFGRVLYYLALFFSLFLLTQVKRLARLPFFLSWWAYSFPLAAITIASWEMHEQLGGVVYHHLALFFLTLVTLVVGFLVFKTIQAAAAKKICVPE
ncbi:MAG TPA: C4-dicarboxylate ABC transporter [Thiotrichales bacterium]|nr:C4-dicarboxylate ABC transporter [Thiotrichales bacterium]